MNTVTLTMTKEEAELLKAALRIVEDANRVTLDRQLGLSMKRQHEPAVEHEAALASRRIVLARNLRERLP